MTANEWITQFFLGALFGALGLGIRIVVGLKKVNDAALHAGKKLSDEFSASTLLTSLLIGMVAGVLGTLTTQIDLQAISRENVVLLIAVGYAGADFIEGFVRKNLPGPAGGAALAAAPGPAAPADEPDSLSRPWGSAMPANGFDLRYAITPAYLTAPSRRRRGIALGRGVRFLVAHDTGNRGSTAAGNVAYYERTRDLKAASAHLFVDDRAILECVPALTAPPEKAWHVLYDVPTDNQVFGADANDAAIGVEYCWGGRIRRGRGLPQVRLGARVPLPPLRARPRDLHRRALLPRPEAPLGPGHRPRGQPADLRRAPARRRDGARGLHRRCGAAGPRRVRGRGRPGGGAGPAQHPEGRAVPAGRGGPDRGRRDGPHLRRIHARGGAGEREPEVVPRPGGQLLLERRHHD
ncbi:MAG: N-acetylmuramoyl-L-alanine amidase [Anaeromyxobacter sp.]